MQYLQILSKFLNKESTYILLLSASGPTIGPCGCPSEEKSTVSASLYLRPGVGVGGREGGGGGTSEGTTLYRKRVAQRLVYSAFILLIFKIFSGKSKGHPGNVLAR